MKPTEAQETRILAHRVLDRPFGDPDDDLAMLSRQLLQADELLGAAAHPRRSYEYGNASAELAKEMADAIDARLAPPDPA